MSAAFPEELPQPILFHQLKHHLQYQKAFIRGSAEATEAAIKAALQTIGSSQLDLYLGQLLPLQLAEEVLGQLQAQVLLLPAAYTRFLQATGSDFRTLTLSDGTDWVLRWGTAADRHVHVHPARVRA